MSDSDEVFLNLNSIIPNIDDASVDEMYRAIADGTGDIIYDENGELEVNPEMDRNNCFVISRDLMQRTLEAVNLLSRFRKQQAEWMELALQGQRPTGEEYTEALEWACSWLVDRYEELLQQHNTLAEELAEARDAYVQLKVRYDDVSAALVKRSGW